jgi:hypothetical protein
VASTNLKECLRPEYADQWEDIAGHLFEDSSSIYQQSGRFKIEGVFDESYFRSSKAYYLRQKNEEAKDEIVRRLRSIPRKHHSSLDISHFGQVPGKNDGVVRSLNMAPSMSLQILMTVQGKSLSRAYNLTRFMTVRAFWWCFFERRGDLTVSIRRYYRTAVTASP